MNKQHGSTNRHDYGAFCHIFDDELIAFVDMYCPCFFQLDLHLFQVGLVVDVMPITL